MNYKEFEKEVIKWENVFRNKSLNLLIKDKNMDWSGLTSLYFSVFKRKIDGSCGNCYLDAVTELRSINEKIYNDMQNLRYKLVFGRNFKIGDRIWNYRSIDFNNEIGDEILKVYGRGAFEEIRDIPKIISVETEKPKLENPIIEKPVLEVEKKKVVKVVKKRKTRKKSK